MTKKTYSTLLTIILLVAAYVMYYLSLMFFSSFLRFDCGAGIAECGEHVTATTCMYARMHGLIWQMFIIFLVTVLCSTVLWSMLLSFDLHKKNYINIIIPFIYLVTTSIITMAYYNSLF